MDVLQERNLMIDHIGVILQDMHLLQELFYDGNQINHLLFTQPIIFGLMNIVIASTQKTSTLQVTYYFLQDTEGHINNSYLLNLIPCGLDIIFTTFSDETIITYDIELPTSGKKIGFNLLDDEDFTIPYITDTIPNSPAVHQLPS